MTSVIVPGLNNKPGNDKSDRLAQKVLDPSEDTGSPHKLPHAVAMIAGARGRIELLSKKRFITWFHVPDPRGAGP